MRFHEFMCLLLIPICIMSISLNINGVTCYCPNNYQSLLLQLKNNLKFNSEISKKLVQWNETMSYCQWKGVTCSEEHVTGLDLSQESINGGINGSSCIFSLQYLKTLNLAFNNFNTEFPSGFHKLRNLRHLNLSNAGFVGHVPILISQLTKLVTLDLSTSPFNEVHIQDFAVLIHNLSEITELFLDGISLSDQREDWSSAISSSLPKLRVLSLSNCNLRGPVDSSLERLHSLSVIDLSQNNLTGPVPEFFINFENLTKLNLFFNSFTGRFPEKIFHLKRLVFLDISSNPDIVGSLPDFHRNSSLKTLILSFTGFSGQLPNSISNLRQLSWLDLHLNQFNGSLSTTFLLNLTELVYLDLSRNNFSGRIPDFGMSKKLTYLDLSSNALTDTIPSNHFEGLLNLVDIVLEKNSFRGRVPSSMFKLPSLRHILLSSNRFEGQLSDVIANGVPSELRELDLSKNNLEGAIPLSIFELKNLRILKLSSNNFSGKIDLSVIHKLRNLTSLDFSNNNLSVIDTSTIGSIFPSFPSLNTLSLASCRLSLFPNFLRNQSSVIDLDLSNNHIGGRIPYWIWSNSSAYTLNLSHNCLTGWENYIESNNSRLHYIDVHDNCLQGSLPLLPPFTIFMDFSLNNLSSHIPPNIGNFLAVTSFFSLSRNNFHGSIPESLCNTSYLGILNLSMNNLTGTIPKCLLSSENRALGVLNLRRNKLTGRINTYSDLCTFISVDLNSNFIQGNIPKYLANCSMLEVLDLGNNQINDQFPCWLKNVSTLRILILRSNKLHGSLQCPQTNASSSWPHLQILDIASNNLSGMIPPTFFENWTEMMGDQREKKKLQNDQLQHEVLTAGSYQLIYYHDSVTVTSKTMQMELVKILTIFTAVDMSCNRFEGSIPEEIGELKAVYILNFSHNSFTGQIPGSLGNLHLLESLDLSSNKLSGVIAAQLAALTFLSFMNLSCNHLVGRIPTSTQIQSLSEGSFQGNAALCGPPLTTNCSDQKLLPMPGPSDGNSDSGSSIEWSFLSAELGFVFGIGIIVFPVLFCRKWRVWYWKHVDDLLCKVFPQLDFVYQQREGQNYRALRWRPY